MAALRGLVSKKKIRFQEDGFDLDLTYITPRIIAMGAPSEGSEGMYRNPMSEVQRLFETRHGPGRVRVYDLRAEKGAAYDAAKFGGNAVGYRFYDHNPSGLPLIKACCEDLTAWLAAHPENVAAIHCKAGKGRTGMMVAAYLVHAGLAPNATAALKMFGDVRTHDGKGVTIPSQMRYVHYYEASLKAPFPPAVYRLRHVRLHTVPNFDVSGGCDPYFEVRLGSGRGTKVFDWLDAHHGRVKNYKPKQTRVVDMDLSALDVRVKGDVKLQFWDWDALSAPDKMFHCWFNTGFIENEYLLLHKDVLDRACKDKACKEFDPDFKVELFLDKIEDDGSLDALLAAGAAPGEGGGDEDADGDDDEADE